MSTARSELKNPSRRLPDIELVSAATAAPARLGVSGRASLIAILAHGRACRRCNAYLDLLARQLDSISEWDGRLVVVRTDADGREPSERDARVPVFLDADARLAALLSTEVPAVVIADQWREIHAVEGAGPDHEFIAPQEVVEWAKYLAVQCPECQGEAL